jgi:BMFP domain-containing protein YqiC
MSDPISPPEIVCACRCCDKLDLKQARIEELETELIFNQALIELKEARIEELEKGETDSAIASNRLVYDNAVLQHRIEELEAALNSIITDSDDLAANPAKWSSHIAMQAMGWTFKDGQAFPPKENNDE